VYFEQVGGGTESRTNQPALFDQESDSGLSGSLTDSGGPRAPADDTAAAAAAPLSPLSCAAGVFDGPGTPYSLTGSYCPARAADARRTGRLATPPHSADHRARPPSSRPNRNGDRTLELPSHDTYV